MSFNFKCGFDQKSAKKKFNYFMILWLFYSVKIIKYLTLHGYFCIFLKLNASALFDQL